MLGKSACLYPSFGFPPLSKSEALPQVGQTPAGISFKPKLNCIPLSQWYKKKECILSLSDTQTWGNLAITQSRSFHRGRSETCSLPVLPSSHSTLYLCKETPKHSEKEKNSSSSVKTPRKQSPASKQALELVKQTPKLTAAL